MRERALESALGDGAQRRLQVVAPALPRDIAPCATQRRERAVGGLATAAVQHGAAGRGVDERTDGGDVVGAEHRGDGGLRRAKPSDQRSRKSAASRKLRDKADASEWKAATRCWDRQGSAWAGEATRARLATQWVARTVVLHVSS